MKNGIARNEKMPMPEVICWKPTSRGRPSYSRVARADRPMENATGTPSSRNSVNDTLRIKSGTVMVFSQSQAGSTSRPWASAMMCSIENITIRTPAIAAGTYFQPSEIHSVGRR